MGVVGSAFVLIRPETTGFAADLEGKMAAQRGGLGKVGNLLGLSVVAGAGAALFGIGEQFEKAFNSIRVKTGATGAVFDDLKKATKDVLKGTAGTMDQVSAAIGGLYQRTRLTGPALEALAKQQVTLARITKTDVGSNVEATTALFNRYGVAVGKQSKELDVLFKASQQGGKGLDTLTATLQKGAPALQAFGFGFEKSTALVASLEKAGVNVAPVLTGLRTAFGKIAKEGADPQRVLSAVFRELRDGKNPTAAMADAIKLFGARGGAELAQAIKSGRFNVDALLKTITNGKGGVIATGVEVSTLGGKFARLRNMAIVALEPIATALVDFVNVQLKKVIDWFDKNGPKIGAMFEKWKTPILIAAAALAVFYAPIITIAAGIALLYAKSETFRNILHAVAGFITNTVVPALTKFEQSLGPIIETIGGLVSRAVPYVQAFAKAVVGVFDSLVAGVRSRWADIHKVIEHALLAIKIIVGVALLPMLFIWRHFHDQILAVVRAVWNAIKGTVQGALDILRGVFDVVLGLLSGDWSRVWDGLRSVVEGAWKLIHAYIVLGFSIIEQVFKGALGWLATEWSTVWDKIGGVVKTVGGVIMKIIDPIVKAIQWIIDHIGAIFGGSGHGAVPKGYKIVNGLMVPVSVAGPGSAPAAANPHAAVAGSSRAAPVINYSPTFNQKVDPKHIVHDLAWYVHGGALTTP